MKEGIANLLNLLPNLIIKSNRSSVLDVTFLRAGAKTIPIKIEPPTQIDEQIICTQVAKAPSRDISLNQ